jgi:hypothetical protein
MPYFFILPAYLVLLIGLIAAAVTVRFVPRLKHLRGCVLGGALGTLIGFAIVNVIVVLAGVAPAWLAQKITFPNWLQQVSKFFVAAILLIGPFIGSGVGVLFGFAIGFYWVYSRKKRATNSTTPAP